MFSLFARSPYKLYLRGVKYHKKKNLGKAIKYYRKALSINPPKEPTEKERMIILKFSPILFTTPDEPFPLRDAVAIMHPFLPIIAYHLFWEDDIDYPLDQEPSDHEIVWVELNGDRNQISNVYTYFHGKVIKHKWSDSYGEKNHPLIYIQWGKHGSLFKDWEKWRSGEMLNYMKRTYKRLKDEGALNKDTPLAKRWVSYFKGSWEDFVNFSNRVEVATFLKKKNMIIIGEYCNAILKWYFLHYNFNPKYSWPNVNSQDEGIW